MQQRSNIVSLRIVRVVLCENSLTALRAGLRMCSRCHDSIRTNTAPIPGRIDARL